MKTNQHLTINNLGPIKNCDIDLSKMMVLDGPQASGKSTVAKTIFFFRTIKNELVDSLIRQYADPVIISELRYRLKRNFLQLFGDDIDENMFVIYDYGYGVSIEISGKSIEVKLSDTINKKICSQLARFYDVNIADRDRIEIKKEVSIIFNDNKEIAYIPAGRSMLSILSESLSHIFFNFDDEQKNMIDYCTRDYINRITKIKPLFSNLDKITRDNSNDKLNPELLSLVQENIYKILQGKYRYINGEEYLELFNSNDKKNIKIKFTSSGQQEVLWILNLIYYSMIKQQPTCFIIEEPEAHLYPDSQKDIAEYIALAVSQDNDCIITTHSPYILGALSNLLDARRMVDEGYNITSVLERENLTSLHLLNKSDFSAYFIENGQVTDAMDKENGLIRNELIDGASDAINGFADDLMYIEREGKK